MEKAWNWLIDKKTNTMRRWRSSNMRSSSVADPPNKSPARGQKDRATKLQKTMGTLPPDLLIDQLGVHSGGRSASNVELARSDLEWYENGGGGGRMQLLSTRNAMKRTQSCVDEGRSPIIPPSDLQYDADEDTRGRLSLGGDGSDDYDKKQTHSQCPYDDKLLLEKRRSRVTFDLKPDDCANEADDPHDGADYERFFDMSQPAIEEALKERKTSNTSAQAPASAILVARLSIDEEYPEGPPDSEWNRPLIEQLDDAFGSLRRAGHEVPQVNYDNLLITAHAETHVFKYADKQHLFFSCTVQLCFKNDGGCQGITPPSCGYEPVPQPQVIAPSYGPPPPPPEIPEGPPPGPYQVAPEDPEEPEDLGRRYGRGGEGIAPPSAQPSGYGVPNGPRLPPYKDEPLKDANDTATTVSQLRSSPYIKVKRAVGPKAATGEVVSKKEARSELMEADLTAQPLVVLPFDLEEDDETSESINDKLTAIKPTGDREYRLVTEKRLWPSVCLSPSSFGLFIALFISLILFSSTLTILVVRRNWFNFNFSKI
uniref:ZP domain-containing protein n=1 Tax=Plectus sambesii TaxID=2011161 RepID=A0A914WBC9_9BILA